MHMAQKVQVILVDDLDGGQADETVQFGLDGASYEVDLSTQNAQKMRDAFAPYLAEARRVGTRSAGRKRVARSSRSDSDAGAVRAWARSNGYQVSDRGRVPATITEAFRDAH